MDRGAAVVTPVPAGHGRAIVRCSVGVAAKPVARSAARHLVRRIVRRIA